LLLQEFRHQLDEQEAVSGTRYTLTAAIPGGNIHSTGSWELPQVAKTVDWIDLMSFDYHGNWDAVTAFNSPFAFDPAEPPVGGGAIQWTWSTAGSVAYFLANRVPANKIVDPSAVRLRIALVRALGLRGAWAWEISNDDNANDLVNAMTGH
jgi:chitinase